jgi:hypothetical protein
MTDRILNAGGPDVGASGGQLVAQNRPTSAKTIVINGREHRFAGEEIGRTDLARMAFPAMDSASRGALTIAYDRGPVDAPSGILGSERKTRVLDGQTFSVSRTDKS